MRGITDLDSVCLTEIFINLTPLDLCSMGQCSKRLRSFVDDHFHSLYFVREQLLEADRDMEKILRHFGKYIRLLKVSGNQSEANLMLDVIANSCGNNLKSLTLQQVEFYEIDMKKFVGVFDNLEILQLIGYDGDQKYIDNFLLGHEYPNLRTLIINSTHTIEINIEIKTEILQNFFEIKRNIKKLDCGWVRDAVLPLIAQNAAEIEELCILIHLMEVARNVMSLAQLRKLKRLIIGCCFGLGYDYTVIIALIKELSANTKLEILGLYAITFTDKFYDVITKLTHLKELRLMNVRCNDIESIEMLLRKLSKLESLTLVCCDFPIRNVLESVYKSDKFRTIYLWGGPTNYIQMLKDFIDENGRRCFNLENPLYIYASRIEGLTQNNINYIEKYGNVKIFARCTPRKCRCTPAKIDDICVNSLLAGIRE